MADAWKTKLTAQGKGEFRLAQSKPKRAESAGLADRTSVMAFRMIQDPNENPRMGSHAPEDARLLTGIIRTGVLSTHGGVMGRGWNQLGTSEPNGLRRKAMIC